MSSFTQIIERFANVGNAAETAYAVLREAILTNVLTPGSRIRTEALAKKLGVSRTPVREALRKLQAEELVTENAGMLTVKIMSEQQLLEIYYTREALEGMAARLAAENAGHIDLIHLREILSEILAVRSKRKMAEVRRLTGEFQLAVFQAARNDVIYRLLKSLQDQIRTFSTSTTSVPGRDDEIVAHCKSLLKAIETRNPDAAESNARANRRRTLELRIKMLRSSRSNR